MGRLLEPLYRAGVARRNSAFDRGECVRRFDLPTISIGNLSVGGTGKTPAVRTTIERLRALGRRPFIGMRGYRARQPGMSDEQQEARDLLGDVPCVAQPDRASGIEDLLALRPDLDALVLDDGFQHRFVARDLDVVLIDATRSPFEDRCLPAGWLREPVTSLARAHMAIITRCDHVESSAIEDLAEQLVEVHPALQVLRARHAWHDVDRSAVRARRVILACAIGHPNAFARHAEREGAQIVASVVRPDHHHWSQSEVRTLEERARAEGASILTTQKDWTKLRTHIREADRVLRPSVRFEFEGGSEPFDRALAGVIARHTPDDALLSSSS